MAHLEDGSNLLYTPFKSHKMTDTIGMGVIDTRRLPQPFGTHTTWVRFVGFGKRLTMPGIVCHPHYESQKLRERCFWAEKLNGHRSAGFLRSRDGGAGGARNGGMAGGSSHDLDT